MRPIWCTLKARPQLEDWLRTHSMLFWILLLEITGNQAMSLRQV